MRPALLLALGLAACAPSAAPPPTAGLRDETVVLASKVGFEPAAFAGDWYEVARFPGTEGCKDAHTRFEVAGPRLLRRILSCPDGSSPVDDLTVGPHGRLGIGAGERPLWILWTDGGYRTAVVVSPDGTGGQILDRSAAIPGDRYRAAVEVLDFNGFDTEALRRR